MSRRALLLGLPDYDEDDLRMAAAENDVRDLSAALKSAGFPEAAVRSHKSGLTTARIRSRIWELLEGAQQGDHLFVYFSGHGVVRDGHRYLVPVDFDPRAPDSEMLSDLAVYAKARSSKASSVVFVIDACREGVKLELAPLTGTKGGAASPETVPLEVPTIAVVHSCEDGQRSFFDRGAAGRSHFTEVLCDLLQQENGPSTLGEVMEAVRGRFRERGAQQSPSLGEHCHGRAGAPDRILVKEDVTEQLKQRIADSRWCTALREIALFERLDECPGMQLQLQVMVMRAEEAVQQGSAALPQNRWRPRDPVKRVLSKLDALWPNRKGARSMSLPEAALILVVPHLYEAVLALAEFHLAGHGSPLSPDCAMPKGELPANYMWRAWRAAFMGDHRWARRRELVQQRDAEYTQDLAAWQLQRFLHRSGELWHFEPDATDRRSWLGDSLEELLRPAPFREVQEDSRVGVVLRADRLMRLARLLYCSYEEVEVAYDERSAFVPPRIHVGEGSQQWDVDERKAAHVLSLLGRMALDPRRLPEAPAEHIGIDGEMHARAIVESSQGVEWHRKADGSLSLAHTCFHQAFDHALGTEAREVDRHLRWLHDHSTGRETWAVELPQRADARELKPQVRDGRLAYQRPHLHFQLDPERIRELLMGPKLYGDARYAVREAYQNAVDACRYRRARQDYLVRARRGEKGAWVPHVTIRTGTDDQGRPFIECEDNGIGMERRHLDGLFAFAGRRFADSHEFHLEKAQWDEAGIPFWSNSRFGIGVLAYFMLADEVMVWTRRVSDLYSGPMERCLTARILSGSDLFRIGEDLSACQVGGTRVRLYLDGRPDDLRGAKLLDHVASWLVLPEIEVELVDCERVVHRYPAGKLALAQPDKAADVQRDSTGSIPPSSFGVGSRDELGQYRIFCSIPRVAARLPRRTDWQFLPLADGIVVGEQDPDFGSWPGDPGMVDLGVVDLGVVDLAQWRRSSASLVMDRTLTLIVNLKGELAPTLSVDRNRLLAWDEGQQWASSEVRRSLFAGAVAHREITAAHLGILATYFPHEARSFNRQVFAGEVNGIRVPLAEGRPEILVLDTVGVHPLDASVDWITSGDRASTEYIQTRNRGVADVIRGRLAVLRRAGVSLPGTFDDLAAYDAALDPGAAVAGDTAHVLPLLWQMPSGISYDPPLGPEEGFPWDPPSKIVTRRATSIPAVWTAGAMITLAVRWETTLGEVMAIGRSLAACGVQVAELPPSASSVMPGRRTMELLVEGIDPHNALYVEGVSAGRLLWFAATWEIPLAEVVEIARPLAACGIEVAELPPSAGTIVPGKRAIELLSIGLNGAPPFFSAIPAAQLVVAAGTWELSLGEVMEIARPLAACGIEVAELPPGAGATVPGRRSVELLWHNVGVIEPDPSPAYGAVSAARLVWGAATWDMPLGEVMEIARPLAALGIEVAELPPGAAAVRPGGRAVQLVSHFLNGSAPLVGSIPVAHLIRAAATWDMPLGEVMEVARPLAACGIEVAELPPGAGAIIPDIRAVELLSWDLDGNSPFHTAIPTHHLVDAANTWELSFDEVMEVAHPLAACGIEVAELPRSASAVRVSGRAVEMLSEGFDGSAPFVAHISVDHLVRAAARWGMSLGEVAEIARPLAACGIEVAVLPPEAGEIIPGKRAVELLSQDLDRRAPYVTSVTATHIVRAAAGWETSVGEVVHAARSLARCGVPVAEIDPAAIELRPRPWVSEVELEQGAELSPLTVAALAEHLHLDALDLEPDIRAVATGGGDVADAMGFLAFLKQHRVNDGRIAQSGRPEAGWSGTPSMAPALGRQAKGMDGP